MIAETGVIAGLPVWSRESNTFGWRSYLGDLYGTVEDADYALRLNHAGVPTERALAARGGAP